MRDKVQVELTKKEAEYIYLLLGMKTEDFKKMIQKEKAEGNIQRLNEIHEAIANIESAMNKIMNP